ncbi:MAG: radical SAM family heme chaperone HemW [Bacteroidaceae bacterium]|nr:radical SAM family heme chaperone HemW [Bacteroidaceae bacterium]
MAGIYIHIPFCKKRCIYCDFYSTTMSEWRERYVDALCKELELRKDYLSNEAIQTVYLGGGTPSQLSVGMLRQIFDAIACHYSVSSDAEITMEANPDDLTDEYVSSIRKFLPVNRLSMGVQTFNDDKLKQLNRRHSAQQAIDAVKRCQQKGFQNISIDLIYGLPQESLEDWKHDLQTALSLGVQHLSAYHLMYEEGTPLWKLRESMNVQEVDEDLSIQFFETLVHTLQSHGFQHYEISNFCLPNKHSRHNSSYWSGIPYLGCGASAHSFNTVSRQWNIASLTDYIFGIESGKPAFETEELDVSTRYNEYVMTGLRTSKGISMSLIQNRFGHHYLQYLIDQATPHILEGNLQKTEDCIKLSHQGIFISDGIMSDLMYV